MDYAEAIVEFFVDRRGKGSAVSSADEQLVLLWERSDIPVSVVFAGIDQAFERKSEAPRSLSDCSRWIKSGYKKWVGGEHLATVSRKVGDMAGGRIDPDQLPSGRTPQAADAPTRQTPLEEALNRLSELSKVQEPALAAAAQELHGDLIAMGTKVTDSVLLVIDEALAEAALERLSRGQRVSVSVAAERPFDARKMSAVAWARARAHEVIRILQG